MPHDPTTRWGWHERVTFFRIREKWPQLANWRSCQGLYCAKDFEERKLFSVLIDIAVNEDGNTTIKTNELIPLIKKFKVSNWPKPKEFELAKVRYQDLTADQKQALTWLQYWLGINIKPRNPKYHAPISSAYSGKNGLHASVSRSGTGRAWRRGEKRRG